MSGEARRILLEAIVIVTLGVVLGLSIHYRTVLSAFSGASPPPPLTEPALYPVPVGLGEVRELAAGGAVLVDARSEELFAEGHLPAARSLPLGEADERLASLRGEIPSDSVVIIYCSGYGCPDSFDLGVKLIETGWRDVRVFEGGYPEWRDAGLPVEKGEK